MWTPWGPGEVSCTESCPHFGSIDIKKAYFGTQQSVLDTEVDVLISGVSL